MKGRQILFCMGFVVSAIAGASGQTPVTMAYWDFGPDSGYTEEVLIDNIADAPVVVFWEGEKDFNGKAGVSYVDQAGTPHPSGRAAAWNNVNACSELIITINTTGWSELVLRWDYFSENTDIDNLGPSTFDMDYRVGETGDWVELLNNEPLTRDSNWHGFTKDLTAVDAVEDQPFIQLRINDLARGDESGGTFKIDNIELVGLPMPASIALQAPNGGENLMTGDIFNIGWATGGAVDFVRLEYSVNNGADWIEIDTVPDTGSFAWEIPDANSLDCLVRVSSAANPQVNDTSDATFRMFRCLLNFDLNGDCYIDMRDLALLASEWLLCGDVLDPRCL